MSRQTLRSLSAMFVVCLPLCVAAPCRAADDARRSIVGVWSETWSPGEPTDVDYHDEYAVGLNAEEQPKVLILWRNQTIEKERLDEGVLTFTLHTSFPVKYSLSLANEGKSMIGTATTPKKTVRVIWKRLR